MINFQQLEEKKEEHRLSFLIAKPFPHLIIDHFCEEEKAIELLEQVPEITTRSRDYVFASNKFERSSIRDISERFCEFTDDLLSNNFKSYLQFISNEEIFIDREMHGGGIHQGKKNSFLDMHIDFNYHPLHPHWYRTLNLIFYLNKDWKPEYGGALKLKDLRTGDEKKLEVPFNRMIIQLTGKHTLHGYDRTNFPDGKFRTSIATYAYQIHQYQIEKQRTTDWHPPDKQPIKKILASVYAPAVKVKNLFFGSSTAKH